MKTRMFATSDAWRRVLHALFAGSLLLVLGACAVIRTTAGTGAPVPREARWALLPFVNHTESPQAGLRAEVIADALLRARGVNNLMHYPPSLSSEVLLEPAERKVQLDAQKWAREQGLRYALQGTVDEWRYKVGVDGEPAVGLVLQIIDLQSGDVVWTGVGARSGWSREALAAVAQKLIDGLLEQARIQ